MWNLAGWRWCLSAFPSWIASLSQAGCELRNIWGNFLPRCFWYLLAPLALSLDLKDEIPFSFVQVFIEILLPPDAYRPSGMAAWSDWEMAKAFFVQSWSNLKVRVRAWYGECVWTWREGSSASRREGGNWRESRGRGQSIHVKKATLSIRSNTMDGTRNKRDATRGRSGARKEARKESKKERGNETNELTKERGTPCGLTGTRCYHDAFQSTNAHEHDCDLRHAG